MYRAFIPLYSSQAIPVSFDRNKRVFQPRYEDYHHDQASRRSSSFPASPPFSASLKLPAGTLSAMP